MATLTERGGSMKGDVSDETGYSGTYVGAREVSHNLYTPEIVSGRMPLRMLLWHETKGGMAR